ncbi:MAG: PAS domain-containing protein [Gammaproteobacteria bacterium]|nr:PAS domain-containing protein [Gammaproteobacteria bacterium]MBU1441650.1 PAS domain-containing protein [Gammaproteobacteria bacterium]MBU2287406.1 PAS domain-containing protein [Gammaproteobacteria bacterium]MBU2407196.1 PAS domain-containing protein [Gammaproteobacteria bacterium]
MDQPEKPQIRSTPPPEVDVETPGVDPIGSHRNDIFFAAIETTRMPMLVTDPRRHDNPIVFANRAFLSMSGYSSEEIVGHNCRFLQGPETSRAAVRAVREAIEDRREISLEILNYRKDGSSFWNALYISPVFNQNKEVVYFFASQLDVSRRRDAEEALGQAQKMEALGQLTGGISHDFNNLLQVMSGHLDLLRLKLDRGKLDEQSLSREIDNIRNAIGKASILTQQLLAFARKQRLEGRSVNLNAIARGVKELTASTIGDRAEVAFELEPALGNCQVDPTQLEVALLNILVNARDAMPDGGKVTVKTRNVVVRTEDINAFAGLPPGDYVSLSVTDTGTGIPQAIIARVMDPFFTTKDEGKGTGLGLSMVYGFAKQSGGTVVIDSQEGVGTTVAMYFPVAKQVFHAPGDFTRRAAHRGGSETILVVDDRIEVAELSRDMLEGLGYKVHVANGGREALALVDSFAEGEKPDMVFSDLIMPGGMNGFALAREVRQRVPGIQILLTTGFAGSTDGSNADDGAEFEIIKKPYRLADLARRVRMILDGPTGSTSG